MKKILVILGILVAFVIVITSWKVLLMILAVYIVLAHFNRDIKRDNTLREMGY